MRTREEQLSALAFKVDGVQATDATKRSLEAHLIEAEHRGFSYYQATRADRGKVKASDRQDITQWQRDQKEWFDPCILSIVQEYAEWRNKQEKVASDRSKDDLVEEIVAKISDLASNGFCVDYEEVEQWVGVAEQRVRAEIGRDSERLDWLGGNERGIITYSDKGTYIKTEHGSTYVDQDIRKAIDAARGNK